MSQPKRAAKSLVHAAIKRKAEESLSLLALFNKKACVDTVVDTTVSDFPPPTPATAVAKTCADRKPGKRSYHKGWETNRPWLINTVKGTMQCVFHLF